MKFFNIFKFFHHIYKQLQKKDKIIFWSALLSNFISASIPSIVLYLSALIIGKLANNDFYYVYFFVILFTVFNVFSSTIATISNFISDSMNDIVWKITKRNILRATSLPYGLSLFEDPHTRKLLTLSLLFGEDIHDSISSLTAVLFGLVGILPLIVLMGSSVWWIPILIIISLLPFVYFSSKFERQSWDIKEEHEDDFSKMRIYERILTQPEFAKEIRLFNMQENLITKWFNAFNKFYFKAQKLRMKNSLVIVMVSILSSIFLFIPIIYITHLYIEGVIGIATVSLIFGGIYGLKEAISSIIYNYSDALRISYQINPYLEFSSKIFSEYPEVIYENLNDDVLLDVKNLSFSYYQSKSFVLRDIDFSFKKNTSIAIVGDNGSGKSTLIKLLCGFYNEFDGNIFWNKNINNPKIFGMFQDFSKLPLTIYDSLIANEKNKESIKKHLEAVDLNFLTDHLDEVLSVEMGGRDLSLGQWQKLSLARVLLHADQADLLIFDEPNSALDPESESKIISLILELSKTKTSIIISHRMAVAKFVDSIIVLDNGVIIESGDHDTLMDLRGKYYNMFTTQSKFYV